MGIVLYDHQGGRSIELQTAERRDVPNYQASGLSYHEQQQHTRLDGRYGGRVRERAPSTAVYNCHGLVFAARRTAVHEAAAIYNILADDRYAVIQPPDVLAGDLMLYFSPDTGDIEHSAVVIVPPSDAPLGIPRVLSKWGRYKELLHWANDCPYDFSQGKYYRVVR